ncbi:P-loop containing nucleoside triphosphate hydrolase protein [Mycena rosella]|uniref:P-loop containing nucleoside triphosphate hydrolase protein n=1 Tax=Mycena rosella TaxID=1033263 RepID=A0AAD7FRA0_MYCRO|nr:P-loop containing nucleoside triphosphate hydrolase protein [Mycena rosella]
MHVREGKINLVDLAGLEDNKLTGNGPSRMVESVAMNKSLSMLGQVPRIPYRNAKFTRIPQDMLGGSSVGLLICNLAPGAKFRQDMLNILNFDVRRRVWRSPSANCQFFFILGLSWSYRAHAHSNKGDLQVARELYQRAEVCVPDNVKLKERWILFVVHVFLTCPAHTRIGAIIPTHELNSYTMQTVIDNYRTTVGFVLFIALNDLLVCLG